MSAAKGTVGVDEAVVLVEHAFISEAGEPVAWLYVGAEHELSLFGSPGALSRLAAGLLGAANAAERLGAGQLALAGCSRAE
jgi:hypothetical protein